MAEFFGFIIAMVIVSAYWFFLIRAAVAAGIKKAKADEIKETKMIEKETK